MSHTVSPLLQSEQLSWPEWVAQLWPRLSCSDDDREDLGEWLSDLFRDNLLGVYENDDLSGQSCSTLLSSILHATSSPGWVAGVKTIIHICRSGSMLLPLHT